MKSLSHVRLFATPWTIAHQGPLSMGFSRQEHWSGLPFPSPGDPPNPEIEPRSPSLQADTLSHQGSPYLHGPGVIIRSLEEDLLPWWKTSSLVAQMVKRLPIMQVDPGSIRGMEGSPGEGNGNALQYSCLENPMDGGAEQAIVHGVTKSQT